MKKKYSELTPDEIQELDELADLLSQTPSIKDLVNFYINSKTLRLESVEADTYSFVYKYLNLHDK